jgi:predicted nucleic acid-binding Zn ribbon protein
MYCPKCGTENPDNAQLCSSCNYVLEYQNTAKSKARISKTVICSVLLAGLAVILAICVKPTLAFISAVFGFFALIVAIAQTIRGKKKLSGKRIAIGVFILGQIILLTYWRIDAAPIANDYTIYDIRSASLKHNKSYALLKSLSDENDDLTDVLAIGLSLWDIHNLEEINKIFKEDNLQAISQQLQDSADNIITIWQHAQKGRDILTKLDAFPEIADLTEPYWNYQLSWAQNFKHLIFLHRYYACLQSCQGNHETAIRELIKLDSITRKMILNTRTLVVWLIVTGCFYADIETANFIINNPHTPQKLITVLKQHIVPISDEHISLRNSLIFEYLMFKNHLLKITKEPRFRYSYFPPLKLNSTLKLYRNFCDKWIQNLAHYIPEFTSTNEFPMQTALVLQDI